MPPEEVEEVEEAEPPATKQVAEARPPKKAAPAPASAPAAVVKTDLSYIERAPAFFTREPDSEGCAIPRFAQVQTVCML